MGRGRARGMSRVRPRSFRHGRSAMTAETITTMPADTAIHPGWVRLCHWINVVAILVIIGSGWQIYNASPLFKFEFSKHIALGQWLGGALLWHFAAMWVLVINGIVYPRAYGFPMKIRMPTKLGFKNPKYVVAMEVTNTDRGGYWENQGYNWFSGL
jgi:thiosulfate reductase cytochrome b subunit